MKPLEYIKQVSNIFSLEPEVLGRLNEWEMVIRQYYIVESDLERLINLMRLYESGICIISPRNYETKNTRLAPYFKILYARVLSRQKLHLSAVIELEKIREIFQDPKWPFMRKLYAESLFRAGCYTEAMQIFREIGREEQYRECMERLGRY